MLFIARVIKKPKGNGISPEGCKKIGANLASPCNYFFCIMPQSFGFFWFALSVATLATFAYLHFFMAVIRTFSPPLAPAFEVPIYQGSFYIVQQCHLFVNLFLLGFYELDFLHIFCKVFFIDYLCLFLHYLLKIAYSNKWNN